MKTKALIALISIIAYTNTTFGSEAQKDAYVQELTYILNRDEDLKNITQDSTPAPYSYNTASFQQYQNTMAGKRRGV